MTPLQLHTYQTPNGHKASIMLEEVGLPYTVHVVDIERGAQTTPAFLALNPSNKIPVVVDPDRGRTLVESGAILFYLAERAGRLVPDSPEARDVTLQWVLFQAAHVGPTLGQIWTWKIFAADKLQVVIERFEREAHRQFRILDGRLGREPYLGGADYGIADVMTWPWIAVAGPTLTLDLSGYANLTRWLEAIAERPAVRRGLRIPGLPADLHAA